MKDCLVYISGPITPVNGYSIEDNVAEALRVFLALIKQDIPAYMPQMCGAFPSCFEIPHEKWMQLDFAMVDRCSHMLMLPRWRTSKGSVLEHNRAADMGIDVHYSTLTLIEALVGQA